MEETEEHLALVATIEHGGVYDSASYIAGWEMGIISQLLSMLPAALALSLRAENLRQADLVAMGYGFVMHIFEFRGGFVAVEFRRNPNTQIG